jgi:hypothetical protein
VKWERSGKYVQEILKEPNLIFYTYLWLRNDGTPYYVGKGKGNRAFIKKNHFCIPPSEERILIQEFLCESDAFEAEVFLISYYGRKDLGTGYLLNRTAGGEGFSGGILSEDHRQKISNALKGKPKPKRTEEHCHRLSEVKKGTRHSEETRQKMSRANKNNPYGFKRGNVPSERGLHKAAELHKGKPAWNTGKKGVSIETHIKMSDSAKARWQIKKVL